MNRLLIISLFTIILASCAGRTVYGGGGITPDFFIPVDTSGYTKYYQDIVSGGVLSQYVYSKLVKRLEPSSIDDILDPGYITDQDFQEFVAFSLSKGLAAEKNQIALSKAMIIKDLKALFARYHFGDTGFFRVENAQDKAVTKALQQFSASSGPNFYTSKDPRPESAGDK